MVAQFPLDYDIDRRSRSAPSSLLGELVQFLVDMLATLTVTYTQPSEKPIINRTPFGIGSTALLSAEYIEPGKFAHAVKVPHTDEPIGMPYCQASLLREIDIYKRLDPYPHPFVLRSLGSDPDNWKLYLPYLKHECLGIYLQHHVDVVPEALRLKWCFQLASGVRHLHSLNVFHCDLSLGNVLVDDDFSLKICDFAGASVDFGAPVTVGSPRMSIINYHNKKRWAPEDLRQMDISSMASIFYYILTNEVPFEHIVHDDELPALYARGIFPDTSSLPLGEMIQQIWQQRLWDLDNIILCIIAAIALPP